MAQIEARGLTKRFGATVAVADLDLSVNAGEIFGLVGPDGAGKTTAMRLLTGVTSADAGEARVLGADVTRDPETVRGRIGYVPQSSSLYADLTVLENLRFYAELFGIPAAAREARAARLLAFSRLEPFAERLARNLSGGMRQKLALCAALIHDPEVLFLDEPTIGVDPVSRRDFWLLIYRLLQDGLTLLISTPYLDEAERCHRVGLMHAGHLVACDEPNALRRRLPGTVLEVRGADPEIVAPLISRVPGVQRTEVFGETLHVGVLDAEAAQTPLHEALTSAGYDSARLRPILPSLEDVFISLLSPSAGSPGGTEP